MDWKILQKLLMNHNMKTKSLNKKRRILTQIKFRSTSRKTKALKRNSANLKVRRTNLLAKWTKTALQTHQRKIPKIKSVPNNKKPTRSNLKTVGQTKLNNNKWKRRSNK